MKNHPPPQATCRLSKTPRRPARTRTCLCVFANGTGAPLEFGAPRFHVEEVAAAIGASCTEAGRSSEKMTVVIPGPWPSEPAAQWSARAGQRRPLERVHGRFGREVKLTNATKPGGNGNEQTNGALRRHPAPTSSNNNGAPLEESVWRRSTSRSQGGGGGRHEEGRRVSRTSNAKLARKQSRQD